MENDSKYLRWFYDNLDVGVLTSIYKSMARQRYLDLQASNERGFDSSRNDRHFDGSRDNYRDTSRDNNSRGNYRGRGGFRPQGRPREDRPRDIELDPIQQQILFALKHWRSCVLKGQQANLPDQILRRMIVEKPTRENLPFLQDIGDTDVEKFYDEIMALVSPPEKLTTIPEKNSKGEGSKGDKKSTVDKKKKEVEVEVQPTADKKDSSSDSKKKRSSRKKKDDSDVE